MAFKLGVILTTETSPGMILQVPTLESEFAHLSSGNKTFKLPSIVPGWLIEIFIMVDLEPLYNWVV